jgi:hypothetical protein
MADMFMLGAWFEPEPDPFVVFAGIDMEPMAVEPDPVDPDHVDPDPVDPAATVAAGFEGAVGAAAEETDAATG